MGTETMKIVANSCFGGFGLSNAALKELGIEWAGEIDRNSPDLVEVVGRMGKDAEGSASELRVAEVPDDVEWHITEYDGIETVRENHRTW
jgi:hypothetical protein